MNRAGTPQPVKIEIRGATSVASKGMATVLKASQRDDTYSLSEPRKVVPVTEKVRRLGAEVTRTFSPYSITVLALRA